jgi:hypothetical protein
VARQGRIGGRWQVRWWYGPKWDGRFVYWQTWRALYPFLDRSVLGVDFTKGAKHDPDPGQQLAHFALGSRHDGPANRAYLYTRYLDLFVWHYLLTVLELVLVMAAAAAADKVLISTHLSDVYSPLQTESISISTSKPHVPFPPQASDDEPPPEHAQYASFFHSVQTGLILLRLIHNGLILELISLSTETPPIRFVFPYTVLPNPALVLWETRELHILAITASGSLYRLVLPLQTPQQLWSTHMVNNWCREYPLKYVQEYLQGQVQVQGTHTVAVGLTDGSLIRLDAETIGDKTTAGPSMFSSFPFSFSHSHVKTTGPRACFITIHFLRRSRPSFTKALLRAHISSH